MHDLENELKALIIEAQLAPVNPETVVMSVALVAMASQLVPVIPETVVIDVSLAVILDE